MKSKLLLVLSVLLTIYFLGSIPYYLVEGQSFENHPVFGALYLMFIITHEVIVFVALACEWCGYFFEKKFLVVISSLILLAAALELFVLVIPLVVLVPFSLINLFTKVKKPVAVSDGSSES